MIACRQCPSYKGGRGSRACKRCPEVKQLNILPRARPCVSYVRLPREIIEALSDDGLINNINIYDLLSVEESTILFYLYTLNLTHEQTAFHLNISTKSVQRKNKYILAKLRTYLIKSI